MRNATCIDNDGDKLHIDDTRDIPFIVIENQSAAVMDGIECCYFNLSENSATLIVRWLAQRFNITDIQPLESG